MQRIYCNDWSGVAKLMLASADKLANSGVDFLICPDNIIHRALPYMEPRSPLPTLDSTRLLARAACAMRSRHGYASLNTLSRIQHFRSVISGIAFLVDLLLELLLLLRVLGVG